jgi:hypothetical protein
MSSPDTGIESSRWTPFSRPHGVSSGSTPSVPPTRFNSLPPFSHLKDGLRPSSSSASTTVSGSPPNAKASRYVIAPAFETERSSRRVER